MSIHQTSPGFRLWPDHKRHGSGCQPRRPAGTNVSPGSGRRRQSPAQRHTAALAIGKGRGLAISAPFAIKTTIGGTSRTWGNVTFNGTIQPNGSYNLLGNGSLSFGSFTTNSFAMRFKSPDHGTWSIAPEAGVTPVLGYGLLPVDVAGLGFHANGYGFSMSRGGQSSGWQNHWVVFDVTWVRKKYDWGINLNYDFDAGSLNGSANGQVTIEILPAAPKPFNAQTSFGLAASGGIDSSGNFTVNSSTAEANKLPVPSWNLPNDPGWLNFNRNSFGFDLW